jgi:cellulose synthase/poly-beta-1,6-N-acetylglucosamine synthase-like glycosyltransferase/peptidoglycan/xylan/chitin deacetylase (PgdA/CDA1 family)
MSTYRSAHRDSEPSTTQVLIRARRRGRTSTVLRLVAAGVLLVVFANLLFVEAYVSARFAQDGTHVASDSGRVPESVRDGGPVIDATGAQARSLSIADRTIALTFDDGPDPQWTPKVLDVLKRYGVHATFFVIGAQVARHPGLTRRIVAEGHQLGSHTFSHPELADLPDWRRDLEQAQTRSVIAAAAGVTTSLLRPPYSSMPDALDDAGWSAVTEAAGHGYLTVLNDTDSQDWARPGVDAIVRNATPRGTAGAIVLMHDAGGNRAETVAALDRFVPLMQRRGYTFTTVSGGLAAAGAAVVPAVDAPAPAALVWRGRAMVWAVQAAGGTMLALWAVLMLVGALTLGRTLLLFGFAVGHARRRRAPTWTWGEPVEAPVSIVVPAFNEEKTIAATVRSLALSDHPWVEVLVVDDASTDATGAVVEALDLGNVRLIRVPPGGKATALNTGVAFATHDIIVMVDADTVVEAEAVHRLVQPFGDPAVGAVAGNVKVGNRHSLIARWQHIEYVIGFNLDRRLYDSLGCIPTIPGALGAFRRSAVEAAGGVPHDTLAEDTDLTMAIHRAGFRVVYEESARAWTEAPATFGQLWRQRYRWSYGTLQAIWKHRRAVLDHGPSGRFGRRGLPLIGLFTIALPLLAPILDVLAIYGTFFLDRKEMLVGWVAVMIVQTITAVLAFRLDREPLRPLWALPLQQFAYRQVMYLVLLQSAITALSGGRLGWQKLRRSGDAAVGRPASASAGA